MKRVLFVDDEPRVLRGLERMLFGQRGEWHLHFATSGSAALAEMEQHAIDVVVSDMRMPEMDGAQFLTQVRDQYPGTVRIILSGHTDDAAIVRALPVAHRFMSKPCDAAVVTETVREAMALNEMLISDALRTVVGRLDQLPSTPHIYTELTRLLADSNGSVGDVVDLVEQDAAMTGKILHMVNTAFFGRPQPTTDIRAAVSLLGTDILRNLVLTTELFESFPIDAALGGYFSIEEFQRHCCAVGRVASQLDRRAAWAKDAFAAGLLHDAGKLILASRMASEYAAVVESARAEGRPAFELEREAFGLTHAEIGARLLGLWGLPYVVVDAVAYHHNPVVLVNREFGVAQAVYIANCLMHEDPAVHDEPVAGDPAAQLLTTETISSRLDEWREVAAECLREASTS